MTTTKFKITATPLFKENEPLTIEKTFEFDFKNVTSVYRGKVNQCLCGCGGDYLYTNHEADRLNEGRTEHFIKRSDKAILNDLEKFTSGKYEVGFDEDKEELRLQFISEIRERETLYDEWDEEIGVILYINK